MLKRVVAIFDATQKVRKSLGTLAGDGDLGDLEGIRVGVKMRRTQREHFSSGLAPQADMSAIIFFSRGAVRFSRACVMKASRPS